MRAENAPPPKVEAMRRMDGGQSVRAALTLLGWLAALKNAIAVGMTVEGIGRQLDANMIERLAFLP